jgi:death-on-curing protein
LRRPEVADLVWLNTVAVRQAGGAVRVRDEGALEAAAARPWAVYGGKDLFPTPFDKAAALMEAVIRRHPFVGGNKRTGLLAGAALLHLAGYDLAAPRREMVEVPVAVAEGRIDTKELSRWFETNARSRA